MSSTANTSSTGAPAGRTATTTTPAYTAPPSYTPSDASSIRSTTSTVKKHLLSTFTRKLNSKSTPATTTGTSSKGPKGKNGLTTEELKIRNEARASYYSTR